MKLLLDENLPKKLKKDLDNFEVYTVRDKGWQSKKNGELIKLMLDNGFTILFTFDKNLQHQQNFTKYPVIVFVLDAEDNSYLSLQPLVPQIISKLKAELLAGTVYIIK